MEACKKLVYKIFPLYSTKNAQNNPFWYQE